MRFAISCLYPIDYSGQNQAEPIQTNYLSVFRMRNKIPLSELCIPNFPPPLSGAFFVRFFHKKQGG